MKKIIVVDFRILQVVNAPHHFNRNILTDLKSYIALPDYSVFIYITQPIKNRRLMLKKLRQEKIIDSCLEKSAYIFDFSVKKIAQVVQRHRHIRELEKNSRDIDELITIGLPHSQRFAWLQNMGASLVDWPGGTEQSLITMLNNQLVLGDRPTNVKSAFYENKYEADLSPVALDAVLRYKRDMFTPDHSSINPPLREVFCKQILTELHVLKGLIEEDNPFPEYISLRKFHYGHLIFDGVHFFLEFISVVCIFFHLCHSFRLESHLKEWSNLLKSQIEDWIEKFGRIGNQQERNLLATSPEPRDALTCGEVNLPSVVASQESEQTESCENSSLEVASGHTTLPVVQNIAHERTESNILPYTEKLPAKHPCAQEQPLRLPEDFPQKKAVMNKKNLDRVDAVEIKTTNLEANTIRSKLEKRNNRMSLFCAPATASSSKSSLSSTDSRLSVKSSPGFCCTQPGLIADPSIFIGSASYSQWLRKAASLESCAELNKTSRKRLKKFNTRKKISQEIKMASLTKDDERIVLIPKESTLIDQGEADTDQVTSQIDIALKANTAVNQEALSGSSATACVQRTPGR